MPELVAPETRARVERGDARPRLSSPNLVAGALASARTNSVGVLVPTIANSIFADTVQGLSGQARAARILGDPGTIAVRRGARGPHAGGAAVAAAGGDHHGGLASDRGGHPAAAQRAHPDRRDLGSAGRRRSTPSRASTITRPARRWRSISSRRTRKQLAFIGGDDPRATRRWLGFQHEVILASGLAEPRRLILERNASGGVVGACAVCPTSMRCSPPMMRTRSGFMARLRKCRAVARRAGVAAAGRAVIGLRRSRNGSADLADAEHDQRAWRCDRPHRGRRPTLERGGERRIDLGFELVRATAAGSRREARPARAKRENLVQAWPD